MKKTIARVITVVLIIAFLIVGIYILMSLYYKKTFSVNTWINGIYVTGSSVEDINKQLVAKAEVSDLTIIAIDGSKFTISSKQIGLVPDYTSALKKIMRQRAVYSWTKNLKEPYSQEIMPEGFKWDRDKLIQSFEALPIVVAENELEDIAEVRFDSQIGYYLYDGKVNHLQIDKAEELLQDMLFKGENTLDLAEKLCYNDHEDTAEDKAQRELWSKISAYYECGIVYDMGEEQITFTPAVLSSFLKKDAKGIPVLGTDKELIVDEEIVNQWLDTLGELYNTADTDLDFQTTSGRIVKVHYNNYGTLLDIDAEKEYLYPALLRKEEEIHKPVYLKESYHRGQNDIGMTYIEVDMGEQRMYYYQDGEQVIATDVVTGNIKKRCNTPEGINYIEYMQRNRVLRGPGYATPVKYWIRVVGNIGIHDANWRNEFGGDIYLTNGSHGCVNTPTDQVAALYDMVEEGIPVVMFY